LAAVLRSETVDVKKALNIIYQVCKGLNFASREREIVHRDLKPDNILIAEDGQAKVTDFGLAYTVAQGAVEIERAGSWVYAPPERFKKEAEDARSDIYSLGVILYQMLTGEFPYPFEVNKDIYQQLLEFHTQDMLKSVVEDLERNGTDPFIDPENNIGRIIGSCMHPRRTDRYDSFKHLQEVLDAIFDLRSTEENQENISFDTTLNRILSLSRLGKYDKALRALDQLLIMYPGEAMLWVEAAKIYAQLRQQEVTNALLRQALAVNPEYSEALEMLKKRENGHV